MNKDLWIRIGVALATASSTVAFVWLCWASARLEAHGETIAALQIETVQLHRDDDEQKKLLKEVRDDIKVLLTRVSAGKHGIWE